jgi:hypothetical protein
MGSYFRGVDFAHFFLRDLFLAALILLIFFCETYPETDWSGDGVSDWQERAEWREETGSQTTQRTEDEDEPAY